MRCDIDMNQIKCSFIHRHHTPMQQSRHCTSQSTYAQFVKPSKPTSSYESSSFIKSTKVLILFKWICLSQPTTGSDSANPPERTVSFYSVSTGCLFILECIVSWVRHSFRVFLGGEPSTASGSSSYQHKRLHFCVVDVYSSVHLCRRLVVGQQRRRLRGSLFVVIVFHCYYSRRRRRRHPHFQSSLKGRWYWWQ